MAMTPYEAASAATDTWNSRYPVGTVVSVMRPGGGTVQTVTLSKACLIGERAAVRVAQIGGWQTLRHVRAI